MKKIVFFDLDNTIHSTKNKVIPSETIKLLKELSLNPNVELGLATGRSPSKVFLLGDLIDLFKYKVFLNGAIAYECDKLIYDNPIEISEIEKVITYSDIHNVTVGFVGKYKEYITKQNEDVDYGMKDFNDILPIINEKIFLEEPIYQLWLFSKEKADLNNVSKLTNLNSYSWHHGGADLVDNKTNKAIAIKKLLENKFDYQLIAVGDGHNDIEMIKMADIGIAMGNTGFNELKEKADYIGPHIDDNQLYSFFDKLKIFSSNEQ